MLALALSTVVIASAMGVLSLVTKSQAIHTGDIHQSVRVAQAQQFFRDTFVRLVAGVPLLPPEDDAAALLEGAIAAEGADSELPADDDAPASNFDSLVSEMLGGGMASELLHDGDVQLDVMFEIYFDSEVEGWAVPVLECVVTEPPVPEGNPHLNRQLSVLDQLGFVRCQLRLEPDIRGRYSMYYIPLDPIGEPYSVIDDLEWARFYVLPDKDSLEWVEVHAAYLAEDFPAAVRVVLFTADGKEIDWLFEVQTIIPESAS